jgi:hypothetical protein
MFQKITEREHQKSHECSISTRMLRREKKGGLLLKMWHVEF